MKLKSVLPLFDRVFVRRHVAAEKTEGGIMLPEQAREVPITGEVTACGTCRVGQDGREYPLRVKVGDQVMFQPYSTDELTVGEETLVVLREENIIAIVETAPEEVASR
jgi:chaperonin GroES